MDLEQLAGKLIVVEGADGSGRSTQIARLVEWLEGSGHATVQVGLKRSTLVSEELDQAQEGNILSRTTLSLFYATDFADQLENIILPALQGRVHRAGRPLHLHADGARHGARHGRGLAEEPLRHRAGAGRGLLPERAPEELVQRNFAKNAALDYWESGMDLGLSRDMFDSFMKYQTAMQETFRRLQKTYGFTIVDGIRSADAITLELRKKISAVLAGKRRS